MFYYRITTYSCRGARPGSEYREFLRPSYLGEAVAAKISQPGTVSVTVKQIAQSEYIAATRPKD